jgi:hypothetical protein
MDENLYILENSQGFFLTPPLSLYFISFSEIKIIIFSTLLEKILFVSIKLFFLIYINKIKYTTTENSTTSSFLVVEIIFFL